MNNTVIIQNQIPQVSEKTIHRERLFQSLEAGLKTRFTLVSAPAGYGKTVLVAHWLRSAAFDCGWLTIEEKEPTLLQFWQQVIFALRGIQPEIGKEALEVLYQNSEISIEFILTGLIAEIDCLGKPICLVLDDYFHVQFSQIHQSVRFLVEHCPANFHLILLTRSDPPLPLARYRARGQMVDIREDDLRLNERETESLLDCLGTPSISSNSIAILHQRTEGWAAGIQLSSLAIQKQPNPEAFIAAFSGSQRYIFDYLTDEVLSNLDDDQQEFLLKTSILHQLSVSICETLVGNTHASVILEQLYQQNVFLQPVDESREWFRYHGLFRDVLLYRLKRVYSQEKIKHLHHIASVWYQQAAWGQEALQHAMMADDFERAGELIETMTELLTWSSGFHSDLIHTLEKLPDDIIQSRPRLQLLYARALLLNGQGQEAAVRLDALEKQLEPANSDKEENRHYLGMILTHRATRLAISGEVSEARSMASQALGLLPENDLLTRAQAVHTLGLVADSEGQIRQAANYFQQASQQAIRANHRNLAVISASQQAFTEIGLGNLRQAETTARQALEWALIGSTELPISAYAHTAMAEVLRHQNRLDQADQEIHRAVYLAKKAIPPVRWHTALVQAGIRAGLHDFGGAQAVLQQCETEIHQLLPSHFFETIQAAFCRVWLAQGRSDLARGWCASLNKLVFDQSSNYPNRDSILLVYCRVKIASGENEQACTQLRALYESALRQEKKVLMMETLCLLALCAENLTSAYAHLCETVALAELQGYQRIFLDEGQPLFDLLQSFQQQSTPPLPFVDQLLDAFHQEWIVQKNVQNSAYKHSELETLTDRERDVLTQIASGASNQEIANRLVVSIHTVKKHAANIFIKLGVENRMEAVACARSLGLL